jgi:cobalt-zinc-cadmium efflux system protein
VHDLHVWTISSGMEALSGHVVVPRGHPDRPCEELLRELRDALGGRFGIHHMTLQIEPEGFDEEHVHP